MPSLYLKAGSSSILQNGGSVAVSSACCCSTASGCGCTESLATLAGTTADIEITGVVDGDCFDCQYRLGGMVTCNYDTNCSWTYSRSGTLTAFNCGVGFDGTNYYLYCVALSATSCTVGPATQTIYAEWRHTMGPTAFICGNVSAQTLTYYAPGSTTNCNASGSTCKITIHV